MIPMHDLATLNDAILTAKQRHETLFHGTKKHVVVCGDTGCAANNSFKIKTLLDDIILQEDLSDKVTVSYAGCFGLCSQGPFVKVYPEGTLYRLVKPSDVHLIVEKDLKGKGIVESLLYQDPTTQELFAKQEDIPLYKKQKRIALAEFHTIDPNSIEEYMGIGGYEGLHRILTSMTPEEVVNTVIDSGLRGRGGGGFPTGMKWRLSRLNKSDIKYVVCNLDEGDPGAFMDRALMEGNPHSVLEGLIIAAYAMGSHKGFIYVRMEYPLAVQNATLALQQAREYGLLGENILGTGFDFDVSIHRGAGSFVSGESTALMNALEGWVGEPRPKYVHTSQKGLWGRPSALNNVETFANVPLIIEHGAKWFNSIGTERSKGTKIFSLVGKVNNTGLVEVPMGMTLADIIYKIGGGIPGNKKLKGVQTGGPSGGIIPARYLNTPVDFDELTSLGSMMGSGSIIVIDEDTCAVDLARYFVDFLCSESCGKCLPCREGLKRMREILDAIESGRGTETDIQTLQEIAELMRTASLCALGRTAVNPVLSTIRYFREEYDAHIKDKRCPALSCKSLVSYSIDPEICIGCDLCRENCPQGAIYKDDGGFAVVDQSKCMRCGICFEICPKKVRAVVRESKGLPGGKR